MQEAYLYVILGTVIRLLIAPFFMHQLDMTTILTSSQRFLDAQSFYAKAGWPYLPHALYLYAPFYGAYAHLFPPGSLPILNGYGEGPLAFLYPNIFVALLLIKLPIIMADSIIIYLLTKQSTRTGLIYALSPYSIFITSIWGNFDPLIGLFLMASVITFERSRFVSGILYGLSLMKIYTVFVLGGYLAKLYRKPRELADFTIGVGVAQFPSIYYLATDRASFLSTLFGHSVRPMGGIGIYGALAQVREEFLMGLVFRFLLVLLTVLVALVTVNVARKRLSLQESVVALMLTFIIFSPVTNEQYFAAVLPTMSLIGSPTIFLTVIDLFFIAINATYTYFAKPLLWSSPGGQEIWEAQQAWSQPYLKYQPPLMYLVGLIFGVLALIILLGLIGEIPSLKNRNVGLIIGS